MGTNDSKATLSARIPAELKQRLQALADRDFNGSLTEAATAAVESFVQEDAPTAARLPGRIRERVQFMKLLVETGDPDLDWELLRKEIVELCDSLQ